MKFRIIPYILTVSVGVSVSAQDWPDSMASLGDSITRATLSDDSIGGLDYGQPEHSWSTGNESDDGVLSHYERILAENPGIEGNAFNLADSGASMDDLLGQARKAVRRGVEYVTIEMGANDVCSGDSDDMTSLFSFTLDFTRAIDELQDGLPDATIVVAEIARVKRIFDVGRRSAGCRVKWEVFSWCENVLLNGRKQRLAADARTVEYNGILRTVCATKGIPFDDDVYEWKFKKSNISKVDCFHPRLSGQNILAEITYDSDRF